MKATIKDVKLNAAPQYAHIEQTTARRATFNELKAAANDAITNGCILDTENAARIMAFGGAVANSVTRKLYNVSGDDKIRIMRAESNAAAHMYANDESRRACYAAAINAKAAAPIPRHAAAKAAERAERAEQDAPQDTIGDGYDIAAAATMALIENIIDRNENARAAKAAHNRAKAAADAAANVYAHAMTTDADAATIDAARAALDAARRAEQDAAKAEQDAARAALMSAQDYDIESMYTEKVLSKKVYTDVAADIEYRTEQLNGVRVSFRAARSYIADNRSLMIDPKSKYVYFDELVSHDDDDDENAADCIAADGIDDTIFIRLPRYCYTVDMDITPHNGAATTAASVAAADVKKINSIIYDMNLTAKQAQVLKYSLQGYNHNDIAKMYGVSRQAISKTIGQIRDKAEKCGHFDAAAIAAAKACPVQIQARTLTKKARAKKQDAAENAAARAVYTAMKAAAENAALDAAKAARAAIAANDAAALDAARRAEQDARAAADITARKIAALDAAAASVRRAALDAAALMSVTIDAADAAERRAEQDARAAYWTNAERRAAAKAAERAAERARNAEKNAARERREQDARRARDNAMHRADMKALAAERAAERAAKLDAAAKAAARRYIAAEQDAAARAMAQAERSRSAAKAAARRAEQDAAAAMIFDRITAAAENADNGRARRAAENAAMVADMEKRRAALVLHKQDAAAHAAAIAAAESRRRDCPIIRNAENARRESRRRAAAAIMVFFRTAKAAYCDHTLTRGIDNLTKAAAAIAAKAEQDAAKAAER